MIQIKHINVRFKDQIVFDDASITIPDGKLTAVCGKSGSGKTTLFYILGLISSFKGYEYWFHGEKIDLQNDALKAAIRKSSIGFVFQEKNLHEYLSIKDNIHLYCLIAGKPYNEEKLQQILQKVNLRLDPNTKTEVLSGGEKQRLAIACALAKEPELIIADELTSALDDNNSDIIMEVLKNIAKDGKMVIIATHNKRILTMCDHMYELKDHQIQGVMQEESNISKQKLSHISSAFYSWYAKFHFGESKKRRFLFTMIPAFVISLCIFLGALTTSLNAKYHESLSQFGSNEIFAMNSAGMIPDSSYYRMEDMEGVKRAYPIYQDYLDVLQVDGEITQLHESVLIIPYFDYQKEYFKCAWKQEGEVYLSDALDTILHPNKNATLHVNEHEYTIAGVFENHYKLVQVNSQDRYIMYVPASYFEVQETNMVLLELESFEYLASVPEKLYMLNANYRVTLSQDKYVMQMQQMKQYESSLAAFIVSLTGMIILMLSIAQLFTIHNQKYEISVLKANGLSRFEIVKLMSVVFLRAMITSIVLVSILLVMETLIANIWIAVDIVSMKTMLQILGFSALIELVPSLLALLYMNHFDVEKLLRF